MSLLNRIFLAAEAVACLLFARLIIFLPLSRWAHHLGDLQNQPHLHHLPASAAGNLHVGEQARQVKWAIGAAARRAPWRADCLPRTLAAKIMLGRRRLPSTLFLGVQKAGEEMNAGLKAHAWLCCGEILVAGGTGHADYNVVSAFTRQYS